MEKKGVLYGRLHFGKSIIKYSKSNKYLEVCMVYRKIEKSFCDKYINMNKWADVIPTACTVIKILKSSLKVKLQHQLGIYTAVFIWMREGVPIMHGLWKTSTDTMFD